MADAPNAGAGEAIAGLLDQVVTMPVDDVTYEPARPDGWVARIRVSGGTHEILCELAGDGRLLSARVIEL